MSAVSRRALLSAGAGSVAAVLLAACTPSESGDAAVSAFGGATAPLVSPDPVATPEGTTSMPTTPRVLLAYFSRAGENYYYGDRRTLDVGNTEVLAGMIADRVDCDVYRIEAVEAYSDSYDDTVARNVREQNEDARPAIAEALPDIAGYDTVIVASPIWNVRPPMILSTFVEALDLDGMTLLPVTTHAMSGLGRAVEVYTEAAPGANIATGLAVQGETVTDAGPDVDDWIASVGLSPR
ncbi:hypothetical protein HQQ81_16505 [Microbacteriaceae bacterium VKM Ac-2854]|nr:hypothetical protein [Microbacteriaceae bacterium VKM Ac-2854]